MMEKYGRNYLFKCETNGGGLVTIKPPITMQFDVVRNNLSECNTATLQFLNLNEDTRNKLRKNLYDFANVRLMSLNAGYGVNMPLVCMGNINQAYSYRPHTEYITQIEAFDGGFAFVNSESDVSFPSGTAQRIVIEDLVKNLEKVVAESSRNLSMGAIGNSFNGELPRGNSYSGTTWEILKQITNGQVFVDNGKIYVLANNEYVQDFGSPVIDISTGLLSTPLLEENMLHFDMLFEPSLRIGQKVTLRSVTEKWLNGEYVVISLAHHGTISESVCGEAITTVGFFAPFKGVALQGIRSN